MRRIGPWVAFASATFLALAAVFGLYGWAAIFPAMALYLFWSVWLGFRLRQKEPAVATSAVGD